MDWLQSPDALTLWRAISVLVLAWLAYFFGRTLRPGAIPLIERIATVSDPDMTQPLRRYTRRLTAVWCAYFVVATVLSIVPARYPLLAGAWVWAGTAALFIGEHRLRPWFFPGRAFPSLTQQLRDTWSIWHPGRG